MGRSLPEAGPSRGRKGSIRIFALDSKNRIQVPFVWVAVLTVLNTTPMVSLEAGLTKVPGSVVPRMPDRDQRTSLGVTGMLRTQDVSTGCIS